MLQKTSRDDLRLDTLQLLESESRFRESRIDWCNFRILFYFVDGASQGPWKALNSASPTSPFHAEGPKTFCLASRMSLGYVRNVRFLVGRDFSVQGRKLRLAVVSFRRCCGQSRHCLWVFI